MYIGNGKMSEKEKERVFEFAKKNKIRGLQRSYDYHTSLFTALLISLLLFFFNAIKDLFSSSMNFQLLIIDISILVGISFLFVTVANTRDESFFAIKIREGKLTNSKKRAFKLIDSYSN